MTVETYAIWIGLAALILLTWISTLNVAIRMPSRGRVAELFERQGGPDELERFLFARPQYMLATAGIRSAAVLAVFATSLYLAEIGVWTPQVTRLVVAFLVAWGLVLVFGVAIPHAWAKYSGEWLIVRFLPVLRALRAVCRPMIYVLEVFDPLVRRLAGVPARDAKSFADELEQEILNAVSEGELHGAVGEEEKEMIESVIELGDKRAEEIMTPRTDIVAVPVTAERAAVLEIIRSKGYSRIPVYEDNIDRILGVLYAKDLLLANSDEPFDLRRRMRKAIFIPESKPVPDLLREIRREQVHIAIVLDEYGGTAGLVTLEDILEEVVGELADEYEPAAPAELRQIDEITYEVDARMRVDDLADQLGVELPENEDYETIGGFVFSRLGRIPKVGETCEYGNLKLHVLSAEPRRITRLRLQLAPAAEPGHIAS
jgi:CBS domain containing-hemolysin-like protein